MKKKINKDSEAITQEDIDAAFDYLTSLPYPNGKKPPQVVDGGKYLIFQHEPDPNSPYEYIREGRPLKVKTAVHAIEGEIEDVCGGKLSYSYAPGKALDGLLNSYRENFPSVSKTDIEFYASATGKDFAAAKKQIALTIARKCMIARLEMAQFLHEQLEPTLQIVLNDLFDDAFLFGSRGLGQLVDGAKQMEQINKPYLNHRKKRIENIKNAGRQKGEKDQVYPQDCELFKRQVLSAMQKVAAEGKIQKGKIADHLWSDIRCGNIGGGHQKLARKLKKHGLDYDEILEEFYEKFNI